MFFYCSLQHLSKGGEGSQQNTAAFLRNSSTSFFSRWVDEAFLSYEFLAELSTKDTPPGRGDAKSLSVSGMLHIPLSIRSKTAARMHLTYITSPSVPSVKRDNGSDAAALVKKSVESKQKTAKKKNMVIKRLPTLEFQEFRKNEMDSGSLGKIMGGGEWDKMAIIKIHRRTASKLRYPPYLGFPDFLTNGDIFLRDGGMMAVILIFRTELSFASVLETFIQGFLTGASCVGSVVQYHVVL